MIKLDNTQVHITHIPLRIAHFTQNYLLLTLSDFFFSHCFPCSDCCRGRILSVAWACRAEMKELSHCMSKYTGKMGSMKAMWIARGAKQTMTEAEWDILLNDVIASE